MARVFDPYLIPGTNVLRNLVGATDEDAWRLRRTISAPPAPPF